MAVPVSLTRVSSAARSTVLDVAMCATVLPSTHNKVTAVVVMTFVVPNQWVSTPQVAQPSMNPLVFKIFTSVLRTGNNVVGGISFVTLAKLFGVQSSKGDEVKQVAQQHHTPAEKADKEV